MPTGYQIMSKVKEWQESDEWGYLFGASGQEFTRDVYEQFLASAEGNSQRKKNVEEAWKRYAGRNVADCSGIVYCAMNACGMNVSRFYTGDVPWASGSPYKIVYRKDEHGHPTKPTNIPNEPGIVLWRKGHMALLVDLTASKPTVEAMSTVDGVCRGPLFNQVYDPEEKKDVNEARFTDWGYLAGVTYNGETPTDPDIDWLSFHPTRTLRYNDKGDDVKLLQLALKHQNGADLSGTGNYRTATKAAVEDFQRAKGLDVDGICGRNTWKALDFTLASNFDASDEAPVFRPFRTVRNGNSGDDVRLLQLALNEAIDAGLSGTGSFLSATETAVREFQADQGLDVDGIVGKNTWRALGFSPNY